MKNGTKQVLNAVPAVLVIGISAVLLGWSIREGFALIGNKKSRLPFTVNHQLWAGPPAHRANVVGVKKAIAREQFYC